MADTGALSPDSSINSNRIGGVDWTNPTNALASDNSYAHKGTTGDTNYLWVTDFDAGLASDVQIDGIKVEVEMRTLVVGSTYTLHGQLIKAGALVGSEQTLTNNNTTDAYQTLGGAANLWGLSAGDLIGSDVNATTFGVAIYVTFLYQAYVDHVRMTIYYTTPTAKSGTDTVSSVTETGTKTAQTYNISVANNNQAYILNLKTGGYTFTDDAPYVDGIYMPKTREVIASGRDKGVIYKLNDGSDFDGDNISSTIQTGYLDLGEFDEIQKMGPAASEGLKRLRALFTDLIGAGNLTLTVYTEQDSTGVSFTITPTTTDNDTLNIVRTALSRDIRGKYFSMKITNASGQDFKILGNKIKADTRKIQ